MRARRKAKEDEPINPVLFYGIHIVGLFFGTMVVSRTVMGFMTEEWELHMIFFGIAGLAIIPDSLIGLIGKKSMLTKIAGKMDRFLTFEWGPEPLDKS